MEQDSYIIIHLLVWLCLIRIEAKAEQFPKKNLDTGSGDIESFLWDRDGYEISVLPIEIKKQLCQRSQT